MSFLRKNWFRKIWQVVLGTSSGVVMLEFVVVYPLYLFLLGLVYFCGELALLNNRVLEGSRLVAYVDPSPEEANEGEQMGFTAILKSFLLGGTEQDSPGKYINDYGKYNGSTPQFTFNRNYELEETTYRIRDDFAIFLGSYLYAEKVKLPPGIEGILLLPTILWEPTATEAEQKKLVFALGKQAKDIGTFAMHWNLRRRDDWKVGRPSMGAVVGKSEGKNSYPQAVNYFADAMRSVSTPMVMSEGESSEADSDLTAMVAYDRIFGTFFTDEANKSSY